MMVTARHPKHLLLIASAAVLAAGIASPIASAEDYSGSGSGSGVTDLAPTTATAIKRSTPNGKTDVIKAMGNSKWGDIPQK
jgi:hypothetical protein